MGHILIYYTEPHRTTPHRTTPHRCLVLRYRASKTAYSEIIIYIWNKEEKFKKIWTFWYFQVRPQSRANPDRVSL